MSRPIGPQQWSEDELTARSVQLDEPPTEDVNTGPEYGTSSRGRRFGWYSILYSIQVVVILGVPVGWMGAAHVLWGWPK